MNIKELIEKLSLYEDQEMEAFIYDFHNPFKEKFIISNIYVSYLGRKNCLIIQTGSTLTQEL